jgi:hypothetical protein
VFLFNNESELVNSDTPSLSICSASGCCSAGHCGWAGIFESIAVEVEEASVAYGSAAFCELIISVWLLSGLEKPSSCVWPRRSIGVGVSVCSWVGWTSLVSRPGEDGASVADISYVIHRRLVSIKDRRIKRAQMLGVSYAALVLMCGSLFSRGPFDLSSSIYCGAHS